MAELPKETFTGNSCSSDVAQSCGGGHRTANVASLNPVKQTDSLEKNTLAPKTFPSAVSRWNLQWARRLSYWDCTTAVATVARHCWRRKWTIPRLVVMIVSLYSTTLVVLLTYFLDGVWGFGTDILQDVKKAADLVGGVCVLVMILLRPKDFPPEHLRTALVKELEFHLKLCLVVSVLLTRFLDGVWGFAWL